MPNRPNSSSNSAGSVASRYARNAPSSPGYATASSQKWAGLRPLAFFISPSVQWNGPPDVIAVS